MSNKVDLTVSGNFKHYDITAAQHAILLATACAGSSSGTVPTATQRQATRRNGDPDRKMTIVIVWIPL